MVAVSTLERQEAHFLVISRLFPFHWLWRCLCLVRVNLALLSWWSQSLNDDWAALLLPRVIISSRVDRWAEPKSLGRNRIHVDTFSASSSDYVPGKFYGRSGKCLESDLLFSMALKKQRNNCRCLDLTTTSRNLYPSQANPWPLSNSTTKQLGRLKDSRSLKYW